MSDLAFKTAVELAQAIRTKRIGSLELLEHFLARVERYNPALNALAVPDVERARSRAREADAALARGESWGPLHGLPMTVKESYNVAGLPTTWGAPELKDNVPETNALAVDRLLGAGAVLFGKSNVPLMLADFQSYNKLYGTTNNPWDHGRTPGGSSGGSAAMLAAGLTGLEAGSDIGGSIRNPAHYCGVYGHKPTWGILPPRGHALPGVLTPSDISVVGPLARGPEDLALALDVMAGPDRLDATGWQLELPAPRHGSLGNYRVAVWLDDPMSPVDREVTDRLQAVVEALARCGAKIDEKARPPIDKAAAYSIYLKLLQAVMSARKPEAAFREALEKAAALPADDSSQSAQMLRASVMYYREWAAANEARTHLRWRWAEFFEDYDVLLCPISATAAFPHDHSEDADARTLRVNGREVPYFQQLFWAGLFGVALLPSTIAPAGRTPAGLPVGVQIVGPALGDRMTIDFARLLAQEIGGFVPPPGYD